MKKLFVILLCTLLALPATPVWAEEEIMPENAAETDIADVGIASDTKNAESVTDLESVADVDSVEEETIEEGMNDKAEESQAGLPVEIIEEETAVLEEVAQEAVEEEAGEEVVVEEQLSQTEEEPADASYYVSEQRDGNITWSIDSSGKLTIKGTGNYSTTEGYAPWNFDFDNCEKITSAEVDLSGITSTKNMFSFCYNMKSVIFKNFNTSKVTDMSYMFDNCAGLTSLDLRCFDTKNVTTMENMFASCESLKSLDISSFDTGKVTDMSRMFMACYALPSIDVTGFSTKNVKKMTAMFENCSSLGALDVSKFDTSAATNLSEMFCGCTALKSLDLGGFDLRSVKKGKSDLDEMFMFLYDCTSLGSIVTPKNLATSFSVELPTLATGKGWCDADGNAYTRIPTGRSVGISLAPKKIDSSTPIDPGMASGPAPINQIRFDGNGADEGEMYNQMFTPGKSVKLSANTYKKKGYLFASWNTSADGTGTTYKNKQTTKKLLNGRDEGVTLYAVWKPINYTVVYNGNKKTSGTVKSQTKRVYDTSFEISENKFKKKGCIFKGWNTAKDGSGVAYTEGQKVINLTEKSKGKVTLYAQWEEIIYNISYVLNEGTIAESANPKTFTVSTPKTKLAAPERLGYVFKGWYTTDKFKKKQSYIVKGSINDRTLYARWVPVKYTVIYDGNGKTSGKMAKQGSRLYDTEYELAPNKFAKEGYTFKGWALTPAPGPGDAIFTDCGKYMNLASVNGTKVTLYAIWQ